MARVLMILAAVLLVALAVAAVVLATIDIPPPGGPVERVIPNERFQPR